MPLLYAIEGLPSPYETVQAIAPTAPAFSTVLRRERANNEIDNELEKSRRHPKKASSTLKGYVSEEAVHPPNRKPALLARDLMKKLVFHLAGNSTLFEARALMQREHVRHIPILTENNTLAGILSDRDLLRAGADLQRPVSSEMTKHVLTATPETPIREIAEAMLANRVHSIPIVDKDLRLAGILTTTDILQAIVKHAPLELWV